MDCGDVRVGLEQQRRGLDVRKRRVPEEGRSRASAWHRRAHDRNEPGRVHVAGRVSTAEAVRLPRATATGTTGSLESRPFSSRRWFYKPGVSGTPPGSAIGADHRGFCGSRRGTTQSESHTRHPRSEAARSRLTNRGIPFHEGARVALDGCPVDVYEYSAAAVALDVQSRWSTRAPKRDSAVGCQLLAIQSPLRFATTR